HTPSRILIKTHKLTLEANKQAYITEKITPTKKNNNTLWPITRNMDNQVLHDVIKRLGPSDVILDVRNIKRIKDTFPVPNEYEILWADMHFGRHNSGFLITDKALLIKADKDTLANHNKYQVRKTKKKAIYQLLKWEYFNATDFKVQVIGTDTELYYNDTKVLVTNSKNVAKFFDCYEDEIAKITRVKNNAAYENGQVLSTTLAKKDIDKIRIHTVFRATAQKTLAACLTNDGVFKFCEDGNLVDVEVPADQYLEIVRVFKKLIIEGKVLNIVNSDDAIKYIRQSKVTFGQAKLLAQTGVYESLVYDKANQSIHCNFPLGISFLLSYIIALDKTKDKQQAMDLAIETGLQVFGLAYFNHVLQAQATASAMGSKTIATAQYTFESASSSAVQKVAGGIQKLGRRSHVVKMAGVRHFTNVFKSNFIFSVVTSFLFSISDTFNLFNNKISKAQYAKNITSIIGSSLAYGGGCVLGYITAEKISSLFGINLSTAERGIIVFTIGTVFGLYIDKFIRTIGNRVYEDDTNILTRMYNAVVLNLIYEYMFTETEIDKLLTCFNKIKSKEYNRMFQGLLAAENQEDFVTDFVRPHFEEIAENRTKVSEPSIAMISDHLAQLSMEE
ncbi:MAG: hypothetical protein QM613_00105, partial [Micrococcaceae bacterium]